MSEEHEHEFHESGSGASATFPMQCSALRKNGHVVIKGRPCKIVDMSTSKTGKHGHAKVHIVAIDIFTDKKFEDISPSTHNVDVPNVNRSEWQVINIEDDFMSLMDSSGVQKDNIRLPFGKVTNEGDLGEGIKKAFEDSEVSGKEVLVSIVEAMGEEQAVSFKVKESG